jgi:hypothetical protein
MIPSQACRCHPLTEPHTAEVDATTEFGLCRSDTDPPFRDARTPTREERACTGPRRPCSCFPGLPRRHRFKVDDMMSALAPSSENSTTCPNGKPRCPKASMFETGP